MNCFENLVKNTDKNIVTILHVQDYDTNLFARSRPKEPHRLLDDTSVLRKQNIVSKEWM